MGKFYTVNFENGSYRVVASFSMNRAKLFYDLTKLLESYVEQESGVEDDDPPLDEHRVDGDKFVRFFEKFWQMGWLADGSNSFVSGWAPWAAGLVENITLVPTDWVDRSGNVLPIRRYRLDEKTYEEELKRRRDAGEVEVRRSQINNTDITI